MPIPGALGALAIEIVLDIAAFKHRGFVRSFWRNATSVEIVSRFSVFDRWMVLRRAQDRICLLRVVLCFPCRAARASGVYGQTDHHH
jgi:hypothetical protein